MLPPISDNEKPMQEPLLRLERQIIACEQCPRLRDWCRSVAEIRRRAYAAETYWGRPVPGFGSPGARLFILGLAPGAHGANRTGRVFTGDRSGDWLYRALFETGFASQPTSTRRGDGLRLIDAWVSASVRCAPPANKPSRDEILRCRPFLERELDALPRIQAVVALGRLAFDNYLGLLRDRGQIDSRARFSFSHNRLHFLGPALPALVSSYHPSQQNTLTGRLSEPMLLAVFERARSLLSA